ncbi:siroheme synthase [Paraferrimonas sp. SM1919]|uniref:siroheme synthase n=1 Tax=Paraferrimonas sp. SM1919 TaxID=2662263 RepID=UPI0013D2135B|nr:bifunctional precorrin-2 dehydrogenase/sirohydrochlorin ferrochelatase [Paraferrimonas sp. SM1919]
MSYLPIYIDTTSTTFTVIGAGSVASRKVEMLINAGVKPLVIGSQADPEIINWQQQGLVEFTQQTLSGDCDLPQSDCYYLATNDTNLNQALAAGLRQRGKLVNVVDDPQSCSFITPSIIRRGKVQIAISTSGVAPVWGKNFRAKIETLLPQSLSALFDYISDRRHLISQQIPASQRRSFWERFFTLNQDQFTAQTHEIFESLLNQQALTCSATTYLIDEGIDPELLPLKSVNLLQEVELLIYTSDLAKSLLDLVRRDASRIALSMAELDNLKIDVTQNTLIVAPAMQITQLAERLANAKTIQQGSIC